MLKILFHCLVTIVFVKTLFSCYFACLAFISFWFSSLIPYLFFFSKLGCLNFKFLESELLSMILAFPVSCWRQVGYYYVYARLAWHLGISALCLKSTENKAYANSWPKVAQTCNIWPLPVSWKKCVMTLVSLVTSAGRIWTFCLWKCAEGIIYLGL